MSLPALVLAAGLGTRLDPLTRLVAKPAVPLGDRALIEHVLAWVRAQGVRDVIINLHHRPETITRIVGDGTHLGLAVRYSWEADVLGSAGGPRRALPLLRSDPFVIVNGDTLCDFDLAPMIEAHAQSGAGVTLAVVPNPAPDRYNGIVADEAGVVRGFVPRGAAAGSWHFVGVQIASARVFAPLADGVRAETVGQEYRRLVVEAPGFIRTWTAPTSFLDVGTPGDYRAAARAAGAADARGNVIWPEARVSPDARLTGCVVAGAAAVPAGTAAADAIVTPASLVRPGDVVTIQGDLAIWGQVLN